MQCTAYVIAVDVEEARELAYRLIGKQLQYVAYVLVESDQIAVLYSVRCVSEIQTAKSPRAAYEDSPETPARAHGNICRRMVSLPGRRFLHSLSSVLHAILEAFGHLQDGYDHKIKTVQGVYSLCNVQRA